MPEPEITIVRGDPSWITSYRWHVQVGDMEASGWTVTAWGAVRRSRRIWRRFQNLLYTEEMA